MKAQCINVNVNSSLLKYMLSKIEENQEQRERERKKERKSTYPDVAVRKRHKRRAREKIKTAQAHKYQDTFRR